MTYTLEPLGYIRTCFPEKFGIPRQSLLASEAKGELRLLPPFNQTGVTDGLCASSHVWLSFIFHEHDQSCWKPKVRPPRLGGNQRCGVFATRSSFRPNGLGLSVVKLDKIDVQNQQIQLFFSGVDLLDGTPIVDIKPYIPYADAVSEATNTLAEAVPLICPVIFSEQANAFCQAYQSSNNLALLVTQVLQQRPQPAYHKAADREYRMRLLDVDITWSSSEDQGQAAIEVLDITRV